MVGIIIYFYWYYFYSQFLYQFAVISRFFKIVVTIFYILYI